MESTKSESTLATPNIAASGIETPTMRTAESIRPAVERVASGAHQAVERLALAASQAAGTLDEKSKRVRDAQVRFAEECRGYVKDHPAASLGVAVAAGFLIRHLIGSVKRADISAPHAP